MMDDFKTEDLLPTLATINSTSLGESDFPSPPQSSTKASSSSPAAESSIDEETPRSLNTKHNIVRKRVRTSKPKVKTGCLNCKLRRIKCDEQRPSCSQCTRSKKSCPGYPPPNRSAHPHEMVPIAPKPPALAPLLPATRQFSGQPHLPRFSKHPNTPFRPVLPQGVMQTTINTVDSGRNPNTRNTFLSKSQPSSVTIAASDVNGTLMARPSSFQPQIQMLFPTTPPTINQPQYPFSPATIPEPYILYRSPVSLSLSAQESQYFDFFRLHTVKQLSGYFNNIFWTGAVLRECHTEASVRHAVIALGALYKMLDHGSETPPSSPHSTSSSPSFQPAGPSPSDALPRKKKRKREGDSTLLYHWNNALREYSKAINEMIGKGEDARPKSNRVLLMAIVLLACFDSFVGHYPQAIRQIQNGLVLLDNLRREATPKTSSSPPTDRILNDPVDEDLVQMFRRLAIQAKSYDMAFHFPQPYVIQLNIQRDDCEKEGDNGDHMSQKNAVPHTEYLQPNVSQIPPRFTSLREARLSWDNLCERIFRFTETFFVIQANNGPLGILPEGLVRYGAGFKGQIEEWASAFEPILAGRHNELSVSVQEKAGIAVLKMFQLMGYVLLVMTFQRNEGQFDMFEPLFRTIVGLAFEVVGDEERRAAAGRCPEQFCTHNIPGTTGGLFGAQRYGVSRIKPSFSADLGIVPPLYVVATKCREPVLRRQAIQLLMSSARREGMWDSSLCALIGQYITKIEEEDIPSMEQEILRQQQQQQQQHNMAASSYLSPMTHNDASSSSSPSSVGSPRSTTASVPPLPHVPDHKRVMVRSLHFDLRSRSAELVVGSRGLQVGASDSKSRSTVIEW